MADEKSEKELSESDFAAIGALTEGYDSSGLSALVDGSTVSHASRLEAALGNSEPTFSEESISSLTSVAGLASMWDVPPLSTVAASTIVDPSIYLGWTEPSTSVTMSIGTMDAPELTEALLPTASLVANWEDATDLSWLAGSIDNTSWLRSLAAGYEDSGFDDLTGLVGSIGLWPQQDDHLPLPDIEDEYAFDTTETLMSLDSSFYVPTVSDYFFAVPESFFSELRIPESTFNEFTTEPSSFEEERPLGSQIEEYELKIRAYYAYRRTHDAIQALGDKVRTVHLIYISIIVTNVGQFLPQNKRIAAATIGTTAALAYHYKNNNSNNSEED